MPSLSEFKNSFTGDLARPNRFWVRIPIPNNQIEIGRAHV